MNSSRLMVSHRQFVDKKKEFRKSVDIAKSTLEGVLNQEQRKEEGDYDDYEDEDPLDSITASMIIASYDIDQK